jgi:hypothetical protein
MGGDSIAPAAMAGDDSSMKARSKNQRQRLLRGSSDSTDGVFSVTAAATGDGSLWALL